MQSRSPQVSLSSTDLDTISRFRDAVGGLGHTAGPVVRPRCKPIWKWSASSYEAFQALVVMFWPWLGERRRARAMDVLAQFRNTPPKRIPIKGCTVAGCDGKHLAFGLCQSHYAKKAWERTKAERGYERRVKQFCIRGHAFTPENTYVSRAGKRVCRTCDRLYYPSRSRR